MTTSSLTKIQALSTFLLHIYRYLNLHLICKIPVEQFYSWVCLFFPCCQAKQKGSPKGPCSWEHLLRLTGLWQQECRSASLHPSTCIAGCAGCSSTAKKKKVVTHITRNVVGENLLRNVFPSWAGLAFRLQYMHHSLPGSLGHSRAPSWGHNSSQSFRRNGTWTHLAQLEPEDIHIRGHI